MLVWCQLRELRCLSIFVRRLFYSSIRICTVHVGRYFGSAEGSKFVEMASVDNVKRTWVNYGGAREWTDPTQGQVGSLC